MSNIVRKGTPLARNATLPTLVKKYVSDIWEGAVDTSQTASAERFEGAAARAAITADDVAGLTKERLALDGGRYSPIFR